MDGGDEDLQNFLKDIKTIQGKQKALELKEEASELIKKGKYSEALAIYTSSLKML